MKLYVIILSMVLLPAIVSGQVGNDLGNPAFGNLKTDFDVSLGSSMMATGGGGSMFMNYAFPKLSMQPNQDLKIEAGVLMMNTSMNNVQPFGLSTQPGQTSLNPNYTDSYAYASGEYQVNEKLIVKGSAYKKFNMNSQMQSAHPQAFNFDAYGAQMGFRYKLSENTSIGGSVSFRKGYDPLNPGYNGYYNSYSPFNQYSPFSPSPF